MSVSAIGQHRLRDPRLSRRRSLAAGRVRRKQTFRRLRLVLKLAIGLLIIILLLGVVWVVPVMSR